MVLKALLVLSLLPWCVSSAYCPPGRRFDLQSFPPRCLNCSRILSNPMQLHLVSTQLAVRKDAAKFSPGLPQNRSCGCWRAGNQTVDVYLNASLIVSGFNFPATSHSQWLKEFYVEASNNNITYIPWGTYIQANHTTAQTVLFALPIRAAVFRLTIIRHINHAYMSTEFGVSVRALVSAEQPFLCGCPVLPDGRCCPYNNMTVKGTRCLWCKDPRNLNVIMENECGVCRPGTVDRSNRCVPITGFSTPAPATLDMGDVSISTARVWTIDLILDHSRPILSLYLTADRNQPHPCRTDPVQRCLSPLAAHPAYTILNASHPFLRINPWRVVIKSADEMRSWAACSDALVCVGAVGVVYGYGRGFVQVVDMAVDFNLVIVPPPLTVLTAIPGIAAPTVAEVHSFSHGMYLRMDGPGLDRDIMFQCAYTNRWAHVNFFSQPVRMIQLPDGAMDDPFCTRFRIKGVSLHGRRVRFAVDRPKAMVRHDATTQCRYAPVAVDLGASWGATPLVGDNERVVKIVATSPLPARMTRLAVRSGGGAMLDTGSVLPSYALNMTTACSDPPRVRSWLMNNADMVLDTDLFFSGACRMAGDGHQVYWVVVPSDPRHDRREEVWLTVTVSFALDYMLS